MNWGVQLQSFQLSCQKSAFISDLSKIINEECLIRNINEK